MTASQKTVAATSRTRGVLLGMAVGDAIGLPREGLSARRAARMFGTRPLRHRLVFGRGMISDDTEHACMTAEALLASGGDAEQFARSLAWRMRWWLCGLPAGIGMATLKSIIKLWLGCRAGNRPAWRPRSGVKSAGNGPAMRAPVIGVYCRGDLAKLMELSSASSRITHADPRAVEGATVISLATAFASRTEDIPDGNRFLREVEPLTTGTDLKIALAAMPEYLDRGALPTEYAAAIGLKDGVSGFINHTVPAAIYCWLRFPDDFRTAVEEAVMLGGDTDTVGAIVGGLMGATLGEEGIPREWIEGVIEWPRSMRWIGRLADRLEARGAPLRLFWPGVVARNVLFLGVVLSHGVRRMLPPY